MAARRTLAILPLLWLGVAGPAFAQGFNPPPDAGAPPIGGNLSRKPGPAPAPGQFQPSGPPPGQSPQGFGAAQPQPGPGGPLQPGFAPGPPQPGAGGTQPTQPARQNYADELTDFGVPPQSEMQPNVASATPTTIPGAHLITTAEMQHAGQAGILLVDVLDGAPHPGIPGAIWIPGAGSAGTFNDDTQQKLWTVLSQATQRNPDRPIAFFCAGSKCWESYNAALRAEQLGFKVVLWYRGGLLAWSAAGLPMTNPGQGGAGAQQGGGIGFGAPQRTGPRPGPQADPADE